jgi:hypothetical protein
MAGSLPGLKEDVTVYEDTFDHAKHRVQKELYLRKKHIDNKNIKQNENYWEI